MNKSDNIKKAIVITLQQYEEHVFDSSDATSLNEEMREMYNVLNDIAQGVLDPCDVLCVSDLYSQSPHQHLFEKEMNKEIRY